MLEKGKVAETGTHEELVNKPDGVYAKLHKTQVEMSMHGGDPVRIGKEGYGYYSQDSRGD